LSAPAPPRTHQLNVLLDAQVQLQPLVVDAARAPRLARGRVQAAPLDPAIFVRARGRDGRVWHHRLVFRGADQGVGLARSVLQAIIDAIAILVRTHFRIGTRFLATHGPHQGAAATAKATGLLRGHPPGSMRGEAAPSRRPTHSVAAGDSAIVQPRVVLAPQPVRVGPSSPSASSAAVGAVAAGARRVGDSVLVRAFRGLRSLADGRGRA